MKAAPAKVQGGPRSAARNTEAGSAASFPVVPYRQYQGPDDATLMGVASAAAWMAASRAQDLGVCARLMEEAHAAPSLDACRQRREDTTCAVHMVEAPSAASKGVASTHGA